MTTSVKSLVRRSMFAVSSFVLLSSLVWAQAGTAPTAENSVASAAAPAATTPSPAPTETHENSFVIGNEDVLAINVWKEPEVSRSIPVRPDGKISLPLVGELQAAGETPLKLEQNIAERLKSFIDEPEVTVIVQQINSQRFNVLGYVNRPGSYVLSNSATVLDAIAIVGGFRDFAKQKSMYVLRQNPDGTQTRIPFNYKQVVKGQNPRQNIKLQPGDTIVVP